MLLCGLMLIFCVTAISAELVGEAFVFLSKRGESGLFIIRDHDLLGGILVLCIFVSVFSVFLKRYLYPAVSKRNARPYC